MIICPEVTRQCDKPSMLPEAQTNKLKHHILWGCTPVITGSLGGAALKLRCEAQRRGKMEPDLCVDLGLVCHHPGQVVNRNLVPILESEFCCVCPGSLHVGAGVRCTNVFSLLRLLIVSHCINSSFCKPSPRSMKIRGQSLEGYFNGVMKFQDPRKSASVLTLKVTGFLSPGTDSLIWLTKLIAWKTMAVSLMPMPSSLLGSAWFWMHQEEHSAYRKGPGRKESYLESQWTERQCKE